MASCIFKSIILGAPGSGKGTISKRIVQDFGLLHLASGDLLRAQVEAATPVGLTARQYLQSGKLVPDDVVTNLVDNSLASIKSSWLLDGYPRTIAQAESLLKSQEINTVVNLEVPFETIRSRLENRWTHPPSGRVYHLEWNPPKEPFKDDETGEDLIQRTDDQPGTIQKRLETYEIQTRPLIEFFSNLGILTSFHGTESNVIYPDVKDHLSLIAPNK